MFALIEKTSPTEVHSYHGKYIWVDGNKLTTMRSATAVWENRTWKAVPAIEIGRDYDSSTHKQTGPVVTIFDDRVERVWTNTPKTPQEIEDDLNADRDGALDALKEPENLERAIVLAILDIVNPLREGAGEAAVTPKQALALIRSKMGT